ncbi:hypothetical protein BDV26DRAFT_253079 [Aspergillus bertholletiae]|uniref:Hybrid NRPS/PKS enzyme n=1 Tax=Aspergillus bertholletiae TaxID=1226010 RepID=A0A5N7BLY6_9EURO|nr:hypothetical protein BDV26DRAFT_253079 [Aspergillus bertholletiae]
MTTPIAVIGTACRFPGAVSSPSQLWELLSNPKDVLSDLDPKRLNLSNFYHPNGDHHGATVVPNKSYVLDDDVHRFDAAFFNISAAEAEAMDPQQRLLLETTYEAIEAAGYTLEQMRGSPTAVFVGAMTTDYHDIQARDLDTISRWHATGTSPSILSNRVSYFFDLKGPSMTINTACSSSLVALHQAVQSLHNGDCTTAIVGGVNLLLDPETYISHSNLHMLSPTSRCRMWDRDADGYARGEGCASVVIKTLDQALRDGDDVECIIRGTAVNSTGRSAGITMPSSEAQATLIRQAYERSGLDPVRDRCQYFECHGTGTQAGDPVEAQAIQQVYYPKSVVFSPEDKLYVGSIKTLIGHLEGCAGLAGVMKVIMSLRNQTITPNLLFHNLNPNITPFYDHLSVPTSTVPWPVVGPGHPLRASVNSFGFGGTNAHAIIESYVPRQSKGRMSYCKESISGKGAITGPFVFSGNTQESLYSNIENIAQYIRNDAALDLGDLAWTLAKRTTLPFKVSIAALDRKELLEHMEQIVDEYRASNKSEQSPPPFKPSPEQQNVMGIFTGQGAQWAGMGRDLLRTSPTFRRSIERCERALTDLHDGPSWSLQEELLADKPSSPLSNPTISQPLTTAIQISLCDLLCACGINLDVVVGHSSGEIVAAYAVGIISAEDAMKIAYYRGVHAKPARSGGMLATGLSFPDASAFCSESAFVGRIVVAASNGPASTTLSGDYDAILEAKALFDGKRIFARLLHVDVAYHSHHMIPCAAAYLESLKKCNIQVRTPHGACTWISSVTASDTMMNIDIQTFSATYWVDNMVKPVLFSQAVERSLGTSQSLGACIEVGPHPTLRGPVLDTLKAKVNASILYTSLLHRGQNDLKAASSAVAVLWERMPERLKLGRFLECFSSQSLRLIKGLPAYSWDHRKRYWRESRTSQGYRLGGTKLHPLLGRQHPSVFENEIGWRNILHLKEMPWAKGHKRNGQETLTAAFFLSSILVAAGSAAGCQSLELLEVNDFFAREDLTLEEYSDGIEFITTIRYHNQNLDTTPNLKRNAEASCHACHADGSTLIELCTTRLTLYLSAAPHPDGGHLPPREQPHHLLTPVDVADLYQSFEQVGTSYAGPFRGITSIQRALRQASAFVSCVVDAPLPESIFHPAMLEASFQVILCALASPLSQGLRTPFQATQIHRALLKPNIALGGVSCEIDAFVTAVDREVVEGDVSLYNPAGNPMVQIEGLVMKRMPQPHTSSDRNIFSHMVWESDPFGYTLMSSSHGSEEEMLGRDAADMITLYHFRRALEEIDPRESAGFRPHHRLLYREINRIASSGKGSEHYSIRPSGAQMCEDDIVAMIDRYTGPIDLQSLHSLGQALPAILRGKGGHFGIFNTPDTLEPIFSALNKDICCIFKRIAHKHPHMDVLELDSDTGVNTKYLLDALGDKYTSYSLSCADPVVLHQTEVMMSAQHRNLRSKLIDLTTLVAAEYDGDKYDMVVAANPLHATRESARFFEACREMLKPGGYLVFIRATGRMPLSLLYICGLFPQWWQGYDHDSQTWMDMSTVRCDAELRAKGFSGIDHIYHSSMQPNGDGLAVIVTQAVNDTVMMLREPMNSTGLAPLTETVVFLGGKSLLAARLLQSIQRILAASGTATAMVEDVEQLDPRSLTKAHSIISLVELDKPFISSDRLHETLLDFKELVTRSKHVLWLTDEDKASMSAAVGRALRLSEGDNISLQFLHLPTVAHVSPATVVEVFLRLTWSFAPALTDGQLLWTNEPELHWDGSTLRIPRLVWDQKRNKKYNSKDREVYPTSYIPHSPVPFSNDVSVGLVVVQVRYSCLVCKDVYIWFGTRVDRRGNVVGISDHISSVIQVRPASVHNLVEGDDLNPRTLRATASFMLADLLLKSSSGPVLLYEPDRILAAAVEQGRDAQHTLYFITSKGTDSAEGSIAVHPHASRRMIERVLPRESLVFVDLSFSDDHVVTMLRSIYSEARIHISDLYHRVFSEDPGQLIADTYAQACTSLTKFPCLALEITSPEEISSNSRPVTYPNVVEWTNPAPMAGQTEIQVTAPMFSSSGTYWMVDMATPLGLSILTWMARNGARTFVLSSRALRLHDGWLEEMSRLGATVKPLRMDASNKQSLLSAFTQIKEALPPVAGVCYAPLGLSNEGFEYSAEDDGGLAANAMMHAAMYLDELFPARNLNFFVILTSLVSVIGAPEQVSYRASALFMTNLIQQRRQKGLVGSVLTLGMVVDAGYFAKQSRETIERMMNCGYAPLSESDLHHAFGEVVAAGASEADGHPEIFVGLQMIDSEIDQGVRLSQNLLWHFTTSRQKETQCLEQHDPSTLSVIPEGQLPELELNQDAYTTLIERLSSKVKSMLQLTTQRLDLHTPLLDLGCDSLLAVDIQTWIAGEFDIYITPMDVLLDTIAGLCEKAIPQRRDASLVQQEEDQPVKDIGFIDLGTTASNSEQNNSVDDLALDITSSESSCVPCPSDSGFEQEQNTTEPRFIRVEKMSPHQSQIWFAGHWMKDPTQYNVVISYNVQGNFVLDKFKVALEQAISRHESLRTAFFSDPNNGDLLQGVLKTPPPFFEHVTASSASAVSLEFDRLASYAWQLDEGEVIRVTVVSIGQNQHTVIFGYHHIVMDGASWSTFLHDLKFCYEGKTLNEVAQYVDYSVMLNRDIDDGTFAKELDHWKLELSPSPETMPVLPMAKEKTRIPTDNFDMHTATRYVTTEVADRIKQMSRSLRGTPFHFYLATLQVFLAGLLKTKNLCIGMSDANRKHQEFVGTVGYFLNMLPVRFQVEQTDSFANVFRQTSSKVLAALSNSSIPSNLVVDALNIPRVSNVTPLFQVAINYRVGEITRMSVEDFDLNYDRSVMGNAPYDISFHVTPSADGTCIVEVNCRDYLYSSEATELIIDEYLRLLQIMSSDPSLSIQNSLSPSSPINEAGLSIQRGRRMSHGWPTTLHERFQDMADRYRDRIAITDENGDFTYSQLYAQSTRVKEALLQKGIRARDKVAVLCHPSISSVASMLAIFRIGAVYVPLDLSLPTARHKAMTSASPLGALLCSSYTAEKASELGISVTLNVSRIPDIRDLSSSQFKEATDGDSLSILLYTSGSTGQPKGVCLSQGGFINYLASKRKELGLDSSTVVLQQSSLGFDMGLAQTLNAIMNGGKLIIVPQEVRGDSIEIAKSMRDYKVTFTIGTPSEYLVMIQHGREYLDHYTGWRHACLGGEPFTDQLKREFARLGKNSPIVQDSYGVTEISACTTFETMTASQLEGAQSVGRAIPNTSLYIVDANNNVVSTGEPGEICISGAGVALGYLNEEQTRLKFVEDPYALPRDVARGWTRMYRTGDKAKLLDDGSLILLGRMDGNTEIKLRGLRVDLEDVASTMVNCHPSLLSSAIVCVKGQGDSQNLVAFVALMPGQTASNVELQNLASNLPLPQYMRPATVICLDELPRNSNGKIDRKKIDAMPWMAPPTTVSQPSKRLTLGEGELKLLWQALLPGKQIQPESDFFLLGGNSTLLVRLQGAIRTSVGVSVTLRELYGASTLAQMALKVDARKAETPSLSVNWFSETAIPQNILDCVNSTPSAMPPRPTQKSGCEILLTGATSFIGRVLVQALLQVPKVHRVHCIAVEKEQGHVIPISDKVSVYYGTLLDPTLGLSTADWASLQSCIDVVIHGGSNGHCLNTYNSLKAPNLGSTHRLAQFALESQTPLHYISSGRVILLSGRATFERTSLSLHPPQVVGSDGLTATKWAGEVFLERFAEHTGVSVSIHRPCTPIGDQAPAQDALNSLLRYSATLGATPRLTKMEGYLDFQKVEVVAEEIVTLVTSRFTKHAVAQSPTTSGVSFFHHSSNTKVPVKSFREYMEKVHGRPFRELDLREWSSLALEQGIEPLIPSFLEAIDDSDETMLYPYLGE